MKSLLIFVSLVLVLAFPLGAQVNGVLSEVEGKTILKVWGDHYERGYAQGYLMAGRILTIMDDYFYHSICGNSSQTYNYILNYYNARFVVEGPYQMEATGVMEGIAASGNSLWHNGLNRNLNATDLLMINAIVDLSPLRNDLMGTDDLVLGCSSLSSWGQATQDDPVLQGALIHTRLLDWTPHSALIANPVLIVHFPTEENEQPWASFTYPGLLGALSAINIQDNAAFLNMGNTHGGSNFTGMKHVLLAIREGLEKVDYNGDSSHNMEDLQDLLEASTFRAGTIIHSIWDQDPGQEPVVFECNNYGTWTRTQHEESGLPTDHLAATNHFRLMIEPTACYRYTNLINALAADSLLSLAEHRPLLTTAAGVSTNLMAIQFIPSLNQVTWSTATSTSPGYQNPEVLLNTEQIFTFPTSNHDPSLIPGISLSSFPNPMQDGGSILIKLEEEANPALEIYNLRGQLIRSFHPGALSRGTHQINWDGRDQSGKPAASGIYLLKLSTGRGTLCQRVLVVS
ncbi:MAG: FlgD immunoglobulin-like domain containing protein [Candidatus Cloacimonadota bacterium]